MSGRAEPSVHARTVQSLTCPCGKLGAMKPDFEPGIVREVTARVTQDMCPAFGGVIVHRCYSTWSLVHHAEIAARKVLVDYLDPDEEGIGAHISVEHLAPCLLGATVRVRAELEEVSGRRVVCKIQAFEGTRLLATGRQVQVVLKKEVLRRRFEGLRPG